MIFELGSIFCVIGCLFMLLSLAFFQFFEMAAVSLLCNNPVGDDDGGGSPALL